MEGHMGETRDERLTEFRQANPGPGKLSRVPDDQTDKALETSSAFWIYARDPNVHAFRDLMDRALDKPPQQTTVSGINDGPIEIRWSDRPE
jgi:hypothetical protein